MKQTKDRLLALATESEDIARQCRSEARDAKYALDAQTRHAEHYEALAQELRAAAAALPDAASDPKILSI